MKTFLKRVIYLVIINLLFIIGAPLALLWDLIEGILHEIYNVIKDDAPIIYKDWKKCNKEWRKIK
jgi:hypothetical protein